MRVFRLRGCLANLVGLVVVSVGVVYLVGAITAPWSFHIGGRSTPLMYWTGNGVLHTKSGSHALYVMFFPSPHSSRLRLDGLRPTGGLQGSGWLCVSPGVKLRLTLSGTIYGGWSSTEGSLMGFRLLESRVFDVGQGRGYFDLYGRWRGQELVMDDRGESGHQLRSGLKIEKASVSLDWGSYGDFEEACQSGR